jgi:type III secretory pathway component EscR
MEGFCISRIKGVKHIPERFISFCLAFFLEFFTELPIRFGTRETSLKDETIDIESSSSTENGDITSLMDLFNYRFCQFAEFNHRKYFIRIADIEKVMWYIFHLIGEYFSSSDIHLSIYLACID